MSAIAFEGVDKTYAGRTAEEVLADFSLEVEAGELVALVGASGTGKTTLLSLVAGLLEPDAGAVRIGPAPRLGYVFQQPRLLEWLTVERNVALAAEAAGVPATRVGELLAAVGLAEYGGRYPSALSGGQRQRVAVARAFVIDPDVLLLDEPFSALDELTARRLRLLLGELWAATPVTGLLVTHNAMEAVVLADRVVTLAGRPARIIRDRRVDASRPRSPEDPYLFELAREIVAELVDAG
jgi:ABC-type nitrate/sulfonate/bicarbonate transport system ATPase subunit